MFDKEAIAREVDDMIHDLDQRLGAVEYSLMRDLEEVRARVRNLEASRAAIIEAAKSAAETPYDGGVSDIGCWLAAIMGYEVRHWCRESADRIARRRAIIDRVAKIFAENEVEISK